WGFVVVDCLIPLFCFSVPHEITYFVGCFVNGTIDMQSEFDGEEILYINIQKKEIVFTVPTFIDTDPDFGRFLFCRNPPDSMIFPSREVEPGVENSLICFVNNFYPPSIKVSWTKNGVPVRRGVSVGDYSPNNDQTFRQFSTLTFTPSEGDIYSCTVEHPALETPKTRIWEVEFYNTDPSLGPVIYCGVGLGLGVMGITVGVFFIVKGQQAN
uniref:Ig-like domain-containing protein n=1 Tax=Poecilia mexicana TaxID=48701 RepID=A0A3B3YI81_9TELE